MSEQDQAKAEVSRILRSNVSGAEKGKAIAGYFKKYHTVVKSESEVVKQVVKYDEIFDGALPLPMPA